VGTYFSRIGGKNARKETIPCTFIVAPDATRSDATGNKRSNSMNLSKFELGVLVATPAALATLTKAGINPAHLLKRHVSGDWGDLDAHDKAENEAAIAHEGDLQQMFRVFSSYKLPNGEKVWVITECDRSSTCTLLPSDY
jgi:hypothetical protein